MKIIVLLKSVPDLVEDLKVDDSGISLVENIKFKLNEFDDHALEEAILLKESDGVEVVAMTVDSKEADKMLYTALAKGADKAIKLTGVSPNDSHQFAWVFSTAVTEEDYDAIFTGVQSVDDRDGQLGPLLAAILGIPIISVITGIKLSGNTFIVQKEYSGGLLGEFEVTTPVVLGVQAAKQTPRYAPVSKIRYMEQTASIISVEARNPGTGAGSVITGMAPPQKGEGAKRLESVDELLDILKNVGVV